MPDDRELSYYRLNPNEHQAKAQPSTSQKLLNFLLESLGTNNPESTFAPAADFTLQEPANSIMAKILNRAVNSRNEVYHSTYPHHVPGILQSGELRPGSTGSLTASGVSTSRVPDIRTMGGDVKFVLDPAKMPKTEPLAEPSYGKTFKKFNWDAASEVREPNPNFEYENRTLDKTPISLKAVKQVLYSPGLPDETVNQLKSIAPTEAVSFGRSINSIRARKGWDNYLGMARDKSARDLIGKPVKPSTSGLEWWNDPVGGPPPKKPPVSEHWWDASEFIE